MLQGKRKRSRLTALLCCLIISMTCYLSIYKDASTKNETVRSKPISNVVKDANVTEANQHEKDFSQLNCRYGHETFQQTYAQYTRLTHLCEVCSQIKTMKVKLSEKHSVYTKEKSMTLRFKQLNINYCKVAKIGCTFMSQMFMILLENVSDVSGIFNMARGSVHSKQTSTLKQNSPEFFTASTILMARNPYSRLFSAYIDKIVLPAACCDSLQIRQNLYGEEICSGIPSFHHFLKFILETVRAKAYVNKHWAPIYSLCKPCLTNNAIIIKQESFLEDVRTLLSYMAVPNKTRNIIVNAMTESRTSSSIPGIIKTMITRSTPKTYPLRECYTQPTLVELLWKSFQYQGYIRPNNTFRIDTFRNRLSTADITAIFLKQIENDNITSSERKTQRWDFLVDAFQNIPKNLIEEIKTVYKADFLLFGYDMEPPS